MATGKEEANFAVNLGGTAASTAKQTGDAMEDMRARIAASQAAIKDMASAMRLLKGPGAEIQKQRDELTAKLKAERQALGLSQSALIKQGTTYDKLTEQLKKNKDQQKELSENRAKAMSSALTAAGGPVGALTTKFQSLKGALGEVGAGGAMSLVTLGVAGAVAAVAALVAVLGTAAVAFAKFALSSGNAERNATLFRQAAMGGNAQWGENFDQQVGLLTKTLPLARQQLDTMGASLMRSRVGGQAWVDAMGAVGGATAALGEQAGSELQEFITRSERFNRFRLDPLEMRKSAVSFQEVAKSLSTRMGISLEEARRKLYRGGVTMAQGAAALKDAVNTKFGAINMKKAMSLDVIATRFSESISRLTKGINFEPILKGLSDIVSMFDDTTSTGQALKGMVTSIGNAMGSTFTSSVPTLQDLILDTIITMQRMVIWGLQIRNSIREAFGDQNSATVQTMKSAFEGLKTGAVTMAVALGVLVGLFAAFIALQFALVAGVGAVLKKMSEFSLSVGMWFKETNFRELGSNIIDGIINGIKEGYERAKGAVLGLANTVKNAFASKEGIDSHSPSKWFEARGENVGDGVVGGVGKSKNKVREAVIGMADSAKSGMSGGSSGGALGGAMGGKLTLELVVRSEGGGGGGSDLSASALQQIGDAVSKKLLEALLSQGLAVTS